MVPPWFALGLIFAFVIVPICTVKKLGGNTCRSTNVLDEVK